MDPAPMTIRPGLPTDLQAMVEVIRTCTARLRKAGIDQWDESYPSAETLAGDIEAGNVLVADVAVGLCGMVTVDSNQPEQYRAVPWGYHWSRVAVIHRLAVAPSRQGGGIGKALMRRAEQRARELDFEGIRLEALAANPAAVGLYDTLGYRRCGLVEFRGMDFLCFEKPL
jgi:ribosomal protein S18 acetylase RimI-like enzyme